MVKSKGIRRVVAVAAAAGAMTVGGALLASPANASGSSAKTNGCYARWWKTAWSTTCAPATASGWYRTVAHCANPASPDFYSVGKWVQLGRGSNVNGISAGECAFKVKSAYVQFTG